MSFGSADEYAPHYSDTGLWAKLRRHARRAGAELVERVVLLYLVVRDPATPVWAKTTVVAALGYFIAPIDAIPDLIPGLGFSDDLGVLAVAIAAVAASVTPAMRTSAARIVARWLGEGAPVFRGTVIEAEAEVVARDRFQGS